ncbi:hypothetical protein AUQ48_05595 [Kocuria flava]|uniref:Uncharacterized protein n=1 Tax=Kocuria flava TaxID=446860 RepID=A0A2N4T0P3_9MICC|nr:hypothetical protein [Kocuria flava]PLC11805.1 hypothetical protein AUQ48_05595 [Kocuria flava]
MRWASQQGGLDDGAHGDDGGAGDGDGRRRYEGVEIGGEAGAGVREDGAPGVDRRQQAPTPTSSRPPNSSPA